MSEPFVPIRGLHHYAYRCRDCEETRAFYEDVLGLPLVHVIRSDIVPSTGEHCPYVHIFFRMTDGSHLAFFDLGDNVAAAPSPNTPEWVNHIALRVDSIDALREAKARLEAAGVEVLGITDHHIIESIYFFDPNGIRLELTVPTASAETTARHAREAHAAVEAWTREKQARLAGAAAVPVAGAAAAPARRAPPRSPTGARWMPERRERHLAAIDVKPGAAMESQSGLQLLRPRIYGAYETPSPAVRRARAGASVRSSCTRRATSWATT